MPKSPAKLMLALAVSGATPSVGIKSTALPALATTIRFDPSPPVKLKSMPFALTLLVKSVLLIDGWVDAITV